MKDLVLVGGGGHCKSVISVIIELELKIRGILERPSCGGSILGVEVIGDDSHIDNIANECEFIITVGQIKSPNIRQKIYAKIKEAKGSLKTLIAKTATVSRFSSICEGGVILNTASINAGVTIGVCSIINTGAIVEHDCTIGDFCHISTGAIINGDCIIGERCFIGSGVIVSNHISICSDVIIGAGAVVTKSITEAGIYVGIPAKKI